MKKFQLCRKMIYDPSHHLYSISTYINGNLAMQAKQTVAQSTPPDHTRLSHSHLPQKRLAGIESVQNYTKNYMQKPS